MKIELCDSCLNKLRRAGARGGRAGDRDSKVAASLKGVEVRRRNAIKITFRGKDLLVADWAKAVGVSKKTVYRKLNKGMRPEQILAGIHGAEHLPTV